MDTFNTIGSIVGILSGLTLLIFAALRLPSELRKSKLDLTKEYQDMLNTATEDIKELKAEVKELQDERQKKNELLVRWMQGIYKLIEQLTAKDIVPCWEPEQEDVIEASKLIRPDPQKTRPLSGT